MNAAPPSPACQQTSKTQPVIGHAYAAKRHTRDGQEQETQVVFQSSTGGQTLVNWTDGKTYNATRISGEKEEPKFEFRHDDVAH
ncbi:MAG: hypothetical protein V4469_03465 [Patescibacteria group bacterium]